MEFSVSIHHVYAMRQLNSLSIKNLIKHIHSSNWFEKILLQNFQNFEWPARRGIPDIRPLRVYVRRKLGVGKCKYAEGWPLIELIFY